ncbi:MAG TPA: pitrilysin family protein, partial [Chitinophagaceae bacterium]|nr:pitrilysin family protein [Chitinophagaceae bacterium]
RLKPYEKFTLDNGVEVYTINAGTEEVLQLDWVFNAGNWHEDQNLLAGSTNHLLKNGTIKRTAYSINEHFEYYGSYLNRHCYHETASLTLHCLSRHLHDLLPVVQEIITESAFTEDELQLYKQTSKQRLEVNLQKCEVVANRLIDEYLYGTDHPYGRYSTFEAYDAITREQLLGYFNKYYVSGRCRIFIAGKLPADIIPLMNRYFGGLPLSQSVPASIQHSLKPFEEKKFRITNDKDGLQGAIRIATHFPGRKHPDFPKAQVLNNLFGGYFGSRLMSNIREEKGYTYGIHSFLENHLQQSAWVISTEAGRDVCDATMEEVYKEMLELREELVDEDELLLVRNHMMGTILAELDGPFHIMSKWKKIILNDLGENDFYHAIETIKTISAEELMELANKYLVPDNFYELVVI